MSMVLFGRTVLINDGLKYFIWTAWLTINGVLFYYTFMYYYTGPEFYYLHQMLGYGLCISRASAACINLNSSVLLIPMCKRLITHLRGMKCFVGRQFRRLLDKGRSFHMFCGHVVCLLAVIHCGAHAYNAVYFSKYYNPKYKELNVAKYANQNPLLMLVTSLAGVTGLLLVVSLLTIAAFASGPMRKQHTRFWTTHHMFIVYYVLLIIHAMDGVIKYQTNLHEHTPGCFLVTHPDSSSDPEYIITLPEPEPHGEPYAHPEIMPKMKMKKSMKRSENNLLSKIKNMELNVNDTANQESIMSKSLIDDPLLHQVIIPEPEPMAHDGSKGHSKAWFDNTTHYDQLLINGSWVHVKQCAQPRPKFHACPKEVWKWLCFPLLLYVIERAMRCFYATRVLTTIEEFKLHSCNVIELKLSRKNFRAKPGQSIWVRCPSISHVELHPFSLTSVPSEHDPTFGIHIQVRGDWTSQLCDRLNNSQSKKLFQQSTYSTLNRSSHLSHNEMQMLQVCCNREDATLPNVTSRTVNVKVSEENNANKHTNNGKNPTNIVSSMSKQKDATQEQNSSILPSRLSPRNSFNEISDTCLGDTDVRTRPRNSSESHDHLQYSFPDLYIEGPVGSAMEDIYKYKISLCVAGGIGATPFASVLNSYLKDQSLLKTLKLRRLYLIWTCKSLESFEWFAKLIEELQTKLWENNLPDFLNVHLHVTGVDTNNMEAGSSDNLLPQTTLKRCRLSFCRPDMKDVVKEICNRHSKCTVGVFGCGPRSLLSSVRKSCMRPPGKSSIKFVFNKESF